MSSTALQSACPCLSEALQAAGIGVWSWDIAADSICWNEAFSRLLGSAGQSAVSRRTFLDFIHPDDRLRVQAALETIAHGGCPDLGIEYRLLCSTGGVRWVAHHGRTELGAQNRPARWIGICVDITCGKQAEALRQEHSSLEERLAAIIATAPSVICSFKRRPDGSACFPYASPKIEQLYGFSPELLAADAAPLFACIHPEDLPRVAQTIEESARTWTPWWCEYRVQRPDQREIWVEGHSAPVREADGSILWHGLITDITERKRTEQRLKQTQDQLLHTSRLAGMAEVAGSVLHNVGNVLNSVNISSSLIADLVKQSKLASLARATGLMREHAAELGEFLARDPKGRQLPAYLGQLADYLLKEQASLLKEVESLRTHVEHINDIVAMQQSYAKVGGVAEVIPAAHLVEDALRLNAGTLQRHDVEVIRDFEPSRLPQLTVERHKVLQILVNLIRNAKYACDESGRADKRLTLRITHTADRLHLTVSDNGVGIPSENLPRLFTHGFTTRKDGHGFGLHSGAIAAKELGGTLRAHSEGPGRGATFTLELPLTSPSGNGSS